MGMWVSYPCYSVDASGMIALNLHYPADVFGSVWSFLGELADSGRIMICEQAKDECHDKALQEFLAAHATAVVRYYAFEDHFLAFQREAKRNGIELTNPNQTSEQADPFVIALALMLEGRDLRDLRRPGDTGRVCTVVSYEKPRGSSPIRKIPDACKHYGLEHQRWPEVLRQCGCTL